MRAVIAILLLLSPFSLAGGVESSGKMRKFDLRNCHLEKCIQVRAASGETGNFTALMVLRDISLDFIDAGKKSTYSSEKGYIDFERNVVVIKVDAHKEMLFSLNDMTVKVFKL